MSEAVKDFHELVMERLTPKVEVINTREVTPEAEEFYRLVFGEKLTND